ncbi:MAG TPA: VanW family protein [Polyangiaceae bacterium]|jgi:vancomycin resistance protein YoaR|nr:VanW family protein [Polyangiaceae bacterium]HNZ22849.1 VanW family protein [Polyangiaceae bacterium]HOD21320.1 VanW family protein [Polyangiaceae bacterium]HOE48479.1 VanW family protein [Polyangiaceae bacterium]HOH00528.1 VanW family protein [Polyangiaceae bacterium]
MKLSLHIDNDLVRGLWMAGIFAVAGAIIGLLALPPGPRRIDPDAPGPNFTLLGQRIPSSADADERALQLVRRYANANITVKIPGGGEHLIARSALGAQVQRSRLMALLEQMRDPASPLRQHASTQDTEGIALPVPLALSDERALATLLELKDHVDRPAIDARLDLESRKLLPEQYGIQLEVYGTLARLHHAARTGQDEIEAVVSQLEPRLRSEQLGNVTFENVLGYFETAYARGAKHELRTYNLRLAASRLDGHVILPGEVFDFNEVVGPRDEAHGYKIAPVIAEGELVDGIGGGTCQISGTLHAAAYFAGLEIVARRAHTRPSSYIKMGLDAAVSYPTITLKLKNNFSFPVVLHETVRDGVVRAEILGPKRDLTVTFVRKIMSVQAYQEVERNDPKLPAGVRKLSQRGVPGFKVQKHRILRDGPFAVRERSQDTYPPTTQIVRVGTGDMPREAVDVQDDPHPEYTADEYLVITQGPGILTRGVDRDTPGGPMVENRTPGKTGRAGWMKESGFPVFKAEPAQESNEDGDGKKDRKRDKKGEKKAEKKG